MTLAIFPDKDAWSGGAAEFMLRNAQTALAARGCWIVALAGGSTPKAVYERLASRDYAQQIDWQRAHVFFGDERCVPPDDARSNYRMVRAALLDHVPIPASQVHRMRGEDDPAMAALACEQALRDLFYPSRLPAFDLICLGLGDNGHTASLFPGTAALRETSRWVVAQYVEVMQSWRITLTAPVINAARQVVFLVQGAEKAAVVQRVLRGPYDPDVLPAQLIAPRGGELHWLLDTAAGTEVLGGP